MKSQPQENLIKTSCKNCAFAVYEEDTQIDCAFGRIEKFKDSVTEAFDNDKEFFIIDRLCTYFRDKKWGYNDNSMDKVEEESAISFDIIFDCNEISELFFETIKNFLINDAYYPRKHTIFLAHEYEKPVKNQIIALSKFFNKNTIVSCCFSFEQFIHEQAMKSKNVFQAVIRPENVGFSADYLTTINEAINQHLTKFVIAKVDGVTFVNNFIYKSFQHISPCSEYNKHIDSLVNSIKSSDMYKEIHNDN